MTAPCKRRPFVLYDKAKLPEFYLQEENLEKIIAEMAVTGVQFYSHFFLRHAVGLAQVLDTFAGGVRIKVHKPALRPQSNAANRHTTGPGNRQTIGGSLLERRGWVCTRSISFSGFFVLSLAMMARWAEHRPLLNDLHLLGCKYYRGSLTSLCLCKKLGKRDLKSIADLHKRRNGRDRKGLKSPSVQLTTKMRQATHLSGSLSHFSVGGYLHC